ncbi:MAG: hypothetical protein SFY69_03685 [Planctomycetota bacterium]|nr:hypothetical protein [Planctomycetota bacterium]
MRQRGAWAAGRAGGTRRGAPRGVRWAAALGALLCAVLAGAPGGCGAKGTGEFAIEPGRYAATFDATRRVLRDARFTIERVDAAGGVITTREKASPGLAAPWDTEQTTLGQETSDLLNRQRRGVRVVFEGDSPDAEPTRGRVEVTVYRVQAPGLRVSSRTWQTASYTVDPMLVARGVGLGTSIPYTRDEYLEARLARAIEREAAADTPGP